LILDDAVSSVDTDTEEKILGHLKEDRKDKTTVIIAHRISTIQNADKIIVLDEGEVVEQGTHEELIENKELYYSLYQKQLLEKELEKENGNGDVEA
jgi:ATP-binding cassette subfamily B protein